MLPAQRQQTRMRVVDNNLGLHCELSAFDIVFEKDIIIRVVLLWLCVLDRFIAAVK